METIEKIRNATFTLTRRGYDRREVDSYLSKLADWLEGGGAGPGPRGHDQARARHDRAQDGQDPHRRPGGGPSRCAPTPRTRRARSSRTPGLVESTPDAADDYAKKPARRPTIAPGARGGRAARQRGSERRETRHRAGAGRRRLRGQGPRRGRRLRPARAAAKPTPCDQAAAEQKAIRMVEEGTRRRREIEKVIADLQTRRDAVVKGLEKLSSQLAGRPRAEGAARSATRRRLRPSRRSPVRQRPSADPATQHRRRPPRPGSDRHRTGAGGGAGRRSRAPPREARRAGEARRSASGSSGSSTRSPSPRRACSPTGTRRAWAPTA